MKYIVLFLISIAIIAIAKSISKDSKALIAFKLLILLLICSVVFAIFSTFVLEEVFKLLSKGCLFIAGFDFIYMVFRKLFLKGN